MPRRNNTPKIIPPFSKEDIERFQIKIDKSPGHGPKGDCWIWTGSIGSRGYGDFALHHHVQFAAHRIAYFLHYGKQPFPNALHKCDNPPCVNPVHLWTGTPKDNAIDAARKGRGPLNGDNHWMRRFPERIPRGNAHISRTHPEVMARGERNGMRTHPECLSGEKNGRALLTVDQVKEMRRRYVSDGASGLALAKEFGLSISATYSILSGKTWRHVKLHQAQS